MGDIAVDALRSESIAGIVDMPKEAASSIVSTQVANLLRQLRCLLEEPNGGGLFVTARAGTAYCLRSLRTSGAFISVVLSGYKRIHHGGQVIDIRPGNAVAIAPGTCIDVENVPDPVTGEYLAALHVLPESVVAMARTMLGSGATGNAWPTVERSSQLINLRDVARELTVCANAAQQQAVPRFQHALLGLLLRLHECGVDACLAQPQPRLADKVSLLLHGAPNREWRSVDIEAHFAISGATLRR